MSKTLLDRADARITSANKAIAAAVLIMLVTWNTGIEPMYARLNAILDGRAAYAKVHQTRDAYARLYQHLTESNIENPRVFLNGQAVRQVDLQHAISAVKSEEVRLASELRKLRRESQLPLKLYGLEFFVRPVYAPLIWLLAVAAIVAFVTASRREIFNLLSRYVMRERALESPPEAPLEDHPWWMHPFPKHSGTSVTCKELHTAAGITASHVRAHRLATLCILIGVTITIRVLWIAIAFLRNLSVDIEKHLLPSALAGVLAVLAIAIYGWVRPSTVPDTESAAATMLDVTRREVVLFSMLTAASLVAYPLTEISKRFLAPRPRFRGWNSEQVAFRQEDITEDVVQFIATSKNSVAQVLRANLAVAATLSNAIRMNQVQRRVLAAQLTAFLANGGSQKVYAASNSNKMSRGTKRFAERNLDRVGMIRFGRAVLHDTAPGVFRSAKRRWQPPIALLPSA
jgi:hypothetical protein